MRLRRKARGQGIERHAEILAAAKRLFIEQGYEAATMRKIAQAVGLTTTGVYIYFPTKESILAAIGQETFVELIAELERARASSTDVLEAFRASLRAYVEFGAARPDEYRLAFMAKLIRPPAPGRRSRPLAKPEAATRSFAILQEQVAALMATGRFRLGDPLLVSEVVWASLHGMVALLIDHPGYPRSGATLAIDELVEQIVRGVLATKS